MKTMAENKSLVGEDEQRIASATRRLARANERLSEARAMLRRVTEDRELGIPADANHIKLLEQNVRESESLVLSLTAGRVVEFDLTFDEQNRPQARHVRSITEL